MNNHDEIAAGIEEFDLALSGGKLYNQPMVVNLNTQFQNNELSFQRNRLISELRQAFVTVTGHINVPALLVFCHTYNLRYSIGTYDRISSGFSITCGSVSLEVII